MTRRARSPRHVRSPSLAVVCGTHHPGPVVAAALAPVRGAVDHVLIGADERATEDDLVWYASVADELVQFPFTGPNEFRGWLRDQCDTDWILFLDGDEMPSARLVRRLHELVANRDVAGYGVRMDWVFPDPATHLAGPPWAPSHHLRLLRNDDRLFFPSRKHTGPETSGPVRRVDEPILHLDLIVNDRSRREAKVRRYVAQDMAHMTGGRPTNEQYYLPELATEPQLERNADEDASRISSMLRGQRRHPRVALRFGRRASHEDIRRTLPWQPLTEADARADLRVIGPLPSHVPADSRFVVDVEVRNDSARTWPGGWERSPAIRVAYHWSRRGEMVVFDGHRSALPHPVRPGGDAAVRCFVEAPARAGTFDLLFDVIAEGDRWFGLTSSHRVDVAPSAADQLRAATRGEVIPLDSVMRMRVALTMPGELERQLTDADPALVLPDAVAAELGELPIGGSELDAGGLSELVRRFRRRPPEHVLEFGSGTSTVLLAALAREAGSDRGVITSIEEDAHVAERVRDALRARALDRWASVVVAPVVPVRAGGLSLRCYEPDVVGHAMAGGSPDLVLVAGPAADRGGHRFPVLPIVRRFATHRVDFVLDGGWRELELAIAERWSTMDGIEVEGVVPVGRGMIVGAIEPSVSAGVETGSGGLASTSR